MSQTQVQLVGNVVTGAVFAGIVTANTALNVSDNVGLNSSGINVTGVVTATSFVGDGSNLTGVGIGSDGSINTTGIITASTISANEFIGTGDKLIFSPLPSSFSPTSGATDVSLTSTINITFDQPIYAGVGSVFLRNSSGIGTVIEAIGISSSMINNQTLTINPSSNLPSDTDVYVVLPQGVVTNSVGGNIASVSTYNFTTVDFALSSIDPTNGATNVGLDTNITLSFTSVPSKGTGTVELRSGSVDGSLIESFDAASSGQITVTGNDWILNPSSDLSYSDTVYTIIPSTAINNYVGLNTTGADSHSFTTKALALGDPYEGGYLICQASSVQWIVAPSSTEVTRTWYCRNDANTTAQSVSGCTGWFVPTCGQLQNPGYTCRTYWDSAPTARYYSNTQYDSAQAWNVFLSNGSAATNGKDFPRPVRAFRCVSY